MTSCFHGKLTSAVPAKDELLAFCSSCQWNFTFVQVTQARSSVAHAICQFIKSILLLVPTPPHHRTVPLWMNDRLQHPLILALPWKDEDATTSESMLEISDKSHGVQAAIDQSWLPKWVCLSLRTLLMNSTVTLFLAHPYKRLQIFSLEQEFANAKLAWQQSIGSY